MDLRLIVPALLREISSTRYTLEQSHSHNGPVLVVTYIRYLPFPPSSLGTHLAILTSQAYIGLSTFKDLV